MANEEHLAILKQGVEAWNRSWADRRNPKPNLDPEFITIWDLTIPDLSSADLRGAELRYANFRLADLKHANLSHANLSCADLSEADLSGANLLGANLTCANLERANLRGVNLSEADMLRADFRGAYVSRAEFTNAVFRETTLVECDLSEVKGLDFIQHHGPSTIGIDTIYKSKGKIPESFLRGCGVPESFITQMHSLVGAEDGIQFYSCFISYTSKDDEFAKRLHGKMRDAHLRVWFAPEDMKSGAKLHEQIETAIRVFDKLLIVLSEASLQSEWVMTELRKARNAERRDGKRKLFPVRLVDMETIKAWECSDPDTGEDLALEVRKYFIPDFSHWKNHDAFETAFARLLKDLRADESAK